MEYNGIKYHCSMELALDIIGGKWKPIIIWKLGNQTLRFNELQRHVPGITQKMLTQQLRSLEEYGLINRKIYQQIPSKVEYSLTSQGRSLLPVLSNLSAWAISYSEEQYKNKMTDSILIPTLHYYNENAKKVIREGIQIDMSQAAGHFLSLLDDKACILDFGCGCGRDTKYFLERGYEV